MVGLWLSSVRSVSSFHRFRRVSDNSNVMNVSTGTLETNETPILGNAKGFKEEPVESLPKYLQRYNVILIYASIKGCKSVDFRKF